MTPLEQVEYELEISDLRLNMEEATFAQAWAEGRTLSMQQAIALAIEHESSPLPNG